MSIISLLKLSGIAQIVLVLGSLAIPKLLNWKGELQNTSKLIRQIFWNYAAYIAGINFFFGIISVIATDELLNKSILAASLTLFIFLYWLTRILVQFFYFDTSGAPKGFIYKAGECILVALFIALTGVYGSCFYFNIT